MRWSGWVWGADVPPARYFANMPYIPLAVGLPAITAPVTSENGVGFHFKVSRGMIVGAAASWAAAAAAIAVDMRQATETAARIVRHVIASSSRVMLSNLPSNMVTNSSQPRKTRVQAIARSQDFYPARSPSAVPWPQQDASLPRRVHLAGRQRRKCFGMRPLAHCCGGFVVLPCRFLTGLRLMVRRRST